MLIAKTRPEQGEVCANEIAMGFLKLKPIALVINQLIEKS
jgi:hypothetical protein